MTYNGWKMMDKIDVAIRTKNYEKPTYNGFVVEHGDKEGLNRAKEWATTTDYDYELREYTKTYKPEVHTFDNEGFTVRIIKSADGSSQGGRLSFLACEIEKDGTKFIMGVNDELLIDLIKNSEVSKGLIKEKVMFVRKGGQPGFIHEGMEAYKEAKSDMQKKAELKKAKKTNKWEVGGVYSTLTQSDVCLGEVWNTMEEVASGGYPYNSKYINRENPVKTVAWARFTGEKSLSEVAARDPYIRTGKPPARHKSTQLKVTDADLAAIDKLLEEKREYNYYGHKHVYGRYTRVKE